MGAPEAKNENYLRKRVKAEHGEIRKLKWIGRRGAPDDLIWWAGPRMAFVEVKSPYGKLSPLQVQEISRLRKDGFAVYVVHNFEEIDAMIAEVKGT